MLHYTPCQPRGEHCSQCELHTEQRSGTARSPVSSVRRLPSGLASHLCLLRSRSSSGPAAPEPAPPKPVTLPSPRPPAWRRGRGRWRRARGQRRPRPAARDFLPELPLPRASARWPGTSRPPSSFLRKKGSRAAGQPRARSLSPEPPPFDPVVLRVRRAKCCGLSDHWDAVSYQPRGSLLTGPPHTDPWTFLSPPSATQGYRSTPSYCRQ